MKLCRFAGKSGAAQIGLLEGDIVFDLSTAGVASLTALLEKESPLEALREIDHAKLKQLRLSDVKLLAPVEGQEVWAAGVTYLRSKAARMEESDFSANAYDRVYEAELRSFFSNRYLKRFRVLVNRWAFGLMHAGACPSRSSRW